MSERRRTVNDKVQEWLGKEVWIEGTFPMPMPSGDILYSPMVGVLQEVLDDGYIITPKADPKHMIVVPRVNLRSIALAKPGSALGSKLMA